MVAVDVVIITWNDGPALLNNAMGSALDSIGVDVSVVVVDNGSDPAAEVVADPRVTLIRNEENRGVAPARNQGASAGSRPFVCFLDSDARLLPTTLSALLAPVLASADVGLAAPIFVGQPPEASAGRAPTLWDKASRGLNLRSTYRPASPPTGPWWDVDFSVGACQLVRRDAYEQVGGLDESYFYGPEDVDFCLRLRKAGWQVVQVSGAECEHPPRRRFRGLLTRRGCDHAVAVVRHLWKHRGWARTAR